MVNVPWEIFGAYNLLFVAIVYEYVPFVREYEYDVSVIGPEF